MNKVQYAVFPVAGLGSRFLPFTKSNPKEMLPIVDKPLIHFAVEEAINAGIENLIFISSSTKQAVENYFDTNFELEARLQESGKTGLSNMVHSIVPESVNCVYVRQHEPLGLGDAVLCAKQLVSDQPFVVILADDLVNSSPVGCVQQMTQYFAESQSSVIALGDVKKGEIDKYGIVELATQDEPVSLIKSIIEKPEVGTTDSTLAVIGRYLFTPKIFEFIESSEKNKQGEIDLSSAIQALSQHEKVYGLRYQGERYDCGSAQGYLRATVHYALEREDLRDEFYQYLRETIKKHDL